MTIDTNEDGFTRANVEAVCATGQSSKSASTSNEHIGEKGFGFKSVFAIADEVHIRSGIWSFRFEHRASDDGIGMVTPLQASMKTLPGEVTTRITLYLKDTEAAEYERLHVAITEIPATTVIYLRQITYIDFLVATLEGNEEKIVISSGIGRSAKGRTRITRSFLSAGITTNDVYDYLRYSLKISDMPKDERRANYQTSTISVAFPIDPSTNLPKLSDRGQHIFAYLPLHRLSQIQVSSLSTDGWFRFLTTSIQFLIQADFITKADRESITDCLWNQALCRGVARAFAAAIAEYLAKADHPLRYAWLDYLPTSPMERPWESLYSNMKAQLTYRPILQSWEGRKFGKPCDLHLIPPIMLHQGQPLLRNRAGEDRHLAPEYSSSHEKTLFDLGVKTMDWTDFTISPAR